MATNYITLSQLTKSVKSLVNKINFESTATNSKIGDLQNLTTTAKTNLVAAINEAASSTSGGSGNSGLSSDLFADTFDTETAYSNNDYVYYNGSFYKFNTDHAAGAWNSNEVDEVILANEFANIPQPASSAPAALGTAAVGVSNQFARADHVHTKPTYTASEVGALSSNTTYVSSINGNSGAVTLTIPTQVSDLNNDAGYITTETDPTVPAWAKASTKPTYTASEVGALPSSTTYVSSFNGDTGAITYIAPVASVNGDTGAVVVDQLKTTTSSNNTEYNLIGTTTANANTAAVDIYKQDLLSFAKTASLARLTVGSTSMPGRIRLYTSADSASGFTDIKSSASSTNERELTLPDASGTIALTTDIPNVPSWAMASSKPSYTFSELTTHPTTISGYGITDAYTKTEVDGLVSGVLHYKGTKAAVSNLPSSGNTTGDVWHITADGSEWAWDGSDWQELGTAVDLTGYLQSSDIAAWAKAANKPSYTASEVGALASNTTYVSTFNGQSGAITYTAPVTSVNGSTGAVSITASSISAAASDHTHGNITNGGDMTATAAIANGDRLVINDESASKLTSSTITFGSSTTQYLANNGTWQNVPATYDDTALAARVTALEQIPWVTYYTGSNAPSNSQGNNGDLYFQTSQ